MADIDDIRGAGWQQGAIAPASLIDELRQQGILAVDVGPSDIAIVISQDCDVVCTSFALEPTVEFLIARPASMRDGNLHRGKNPRRLQFDLGDRTLEIRCAERLVFDRKILARHAPEKGTALPLTVAALLPEWVAKRYTRAALPDALVERMREAAKSLGKILSKDGEFVSALFLLIEPDAELTEGESYEIELTILAPDEVLADEATGIRLRDVEEAADRILSNLNGVTVRDVSLRAESEYSYAELVRSVEWSIFDELSYRE